MPLFYFMTGINRTQLKREMRDKYKKILFWVYIILFRNEFDRE